MVLHRELDGLLCVGQASHAWMAGQLARRWGNGSFAGPEPYEEFCLGVEQHDVGMAEWDLDPVLDPSTGFPTSFTDLPRAVHLALWRSAPRKLLTQSPYAALLASMHGHALYARLDPPPADAVEYLAEQERLQLDLIRRLGEDPQRARRNQRLLWALDFLSLALLLGWTGPVAAPTRAGDADAQLRLAPAGTRRAVLDPWPFSDDSVAVCCRGRLLTTPSAGQAELRAALAEAPWVLLRFELVPRGA